MQYILNIFDRFCRCW